MVRGEGRGRQLGFPTANVRTDRHVAIPADGIYAGWAVLHRKRLPAAISVGTNPTFEGRQRTVEAYILDFDEDIYGVELGVEFVGRLRGMVKFDSVEALVEQMGRDVEQARDLPALSSRPARLVSCGSRTTGCGVKSASVTTTGAHT